MNLEFSSSENFYKSLRYSQNMAVYIKTMGCSANQYESEAMAGLINEKADALTSAESADTLLVNVCTVKGNHKAIAEIKKLKYKFPEKKLIVTGCITKELIPEVQKIDSNASFLNTHNIHRINEALESDIPLMILDKKPESKVDLPVVRTNQLIGIIPILNGCLHACTYCSTKLVKGSLKSYPMKDIIGKSKHYVREGVKEIWLTSQDNGCYHVDLDRKYSLPELMNSIADIEGDFQIRVGMMNPNHVLKILDKLIEAYERDKIYKFIHIPIQAGNNEILKKMIRNYKAEDYEYIVKEFKKKIPEMTIATDIICGFPSESEEQFADTVQVIRKTEPDIINISRYAKRQGTLAAKMSPVKSEEIKKRSTIVTNLLEQAGLKRNREWIGWKGRALVNEKGKNNTMISRNNSYKPIVLHEKVNMGDFVNVKITGATSYYLIGKIS